VSEHRIIQGDVLDGLRTLPDGCVHMCVTSPPYYALRNYGVDGQIGLEETPEQFIQKMVEVFREVRRVTRDDGVLWLNLGDSYAGSGRGTTGENGIQDAERRQGSDKSDSNRGSQKINALGGNVPMGYKAKDLMEIPSEVARALRLDGWYLRSRIPWIKRNCMPESTTDRPTSAIEYIFLMTKSAKYFYDGEAIRCPASYSADERKGRVKTDHKSMPTNERNGIRPKKQDQIGNPTYTGFNERWAAGKGNRKSFRGGGKYTGGQSFDNSEPVENETHGNRPNESGTRNYRNSDPFFESWQGLYSESENPLAFVINPQSRPELHFATFPDLLAATCIKAGTSEYGCCPKCGAPYQRIMEASGGVIGKSWHPHADDGVTGQVGFKDDKSYKREFKGWKPGCSCDAGDPVGCVVLDPFMGSGTVAVVARELNRSSIGCELNPEYIKIIKKRLQADSQLDTGVVKYRFEKVPAS
jgi:DNA modification methylase